jgi:hypothetical protein
VQLAVPSSHDFRHEGRKPPEPRHVDAQLEHRDAGPQFIDTSLNMFCVVWQCAFTIGSSEPGWRSPVHVYGRTTGYHGSCRSPIRGIMKCVGSVAMVAFAGTVDG